MKIKRIDHIVLPVSDLEAAARFYHETFDMPPVTNTVMHRTPFCLLMFRFYCTSHSDGVQRFFPLPEIYRAREFPDNP